MNAQEYTEVINRLIFIVITMSRADVKNVSRVFLEKQVIIIANKKPPRRFFIFYHCLVNKISAF